MTEDGSEDGTRSIVQAFAVENSDHRIKYDNLGVNRGVSAARNRCMLLAVGDALAFLDADDYWKPDHLGRLVARMQAGHALVISPIEIWSEDSETRVDYRPSPKQLAEPLTHLFQSSFIQTSSCVAIKKSVCDQVGVFDETLQIGEDRDYWLRVLSNGQTLSCSDIATCCYRKHSTSAMTRTLRVAEDTVAFYRKHQHADVKTRTYRKRKLADSLIVYGRLIRSPDRFAARRAFYEAWRLAPLRLDALARLILT